VQVRVENEEDGAFPRSITPTLHQYSNQVERDLRNKYGPENPSSRPESQDLEVIRSQQKVRYGSY